MALDFISGDTTVVQGVRLRVYSDSICVEHAGDNVYVPVEGLKQALRDASDNPVAAIKTVRAWTALTLIEAKAVVDLARLAKSLSL